MTMGTDGGPFPSTLLATVRMLMLVVDRQLDWDTFATISQGLPSQDGSVKFMALK